MHTVPRPRLHALLTAGLSGPVTLVAAAAGWGKTLLATSWTAAGAGGRPVAWVQLTARPRVVGTPDYDEVTGFWGRLAGALGTVAGPRVAAALRPLTTPDVGGPALDGPALDDDPAAGFAAAARLVERPVVLVLDDFQEITSDAVHAGLVRLVEQAPPMLSLLVLTRRDPPWPLARLRLADLVAEVSAVDLAFRVDEAAELFARLGIDLDRGQVTRLVERTEGWPAGLRLVALHLRGRADAGSVVAAFSGDHHGIAGYLITEVLGGQPAELVRELEKISVVDPVTAGLTAALTGVQDGEQLLAELAAAHLVVPATDRPGRWYHLHRLLGDVLRSRPMSRRERRDLYRRAAEWFRGAELPMEAIRSATAGRLWPLAADLAGRHTVGWVLRGRAGELESVLAAVPRAELATHVELGCGLAGARIVRGNDAEVAELLAAARTGLDALPDARAARVRVLVDLIEGGRGRLRGDWGAVTARYRGVPRDPVALARLGLADAELVAVVVDNLLGVAALLDEDLPTADLRLRSALSVELAAPALPQLDAASYLAVLLCERGELDASRARALTVVAEAGSAGLEHAVQVVAAYLALARVALDRADLLEADDWLGRAAAAPAATAEPHVRVLTALVRAAAREAVGSRERALSGLRSIAAGTDLQVLPRALRQRVRLAEALLVARLGNAAAARALLDDQGPPASAATALASARLLLLLGDIPAAVAARRRAEPADHPRAGVDAGLVDAALALAAHDEDAALDRIEDALTTAASFALRRPFLTGAARLRPLLERRLERGTVVPAFVADLLGRMAGIPGIGDPSRARVDPLTEREHTVLRYLASTLTNAEIATELYVSVNTVKTHERALYRKLGAANRRDAVSRARVLDLL